MFITQISIFVENKVGRLAEITEVLAKNNIDISALSVADTSDFGVLRLIVDQPDLARRALAEHGVITKATQVIAVQMEDRQGGLSEKLNLLKAAGITIEYLYAFLGRTEGLAQMVLRVDRPEEAEQLLSR